MFEIHKLREHPVLDWGYGELGSMLEMFAETANPSAHSNASSQWLIGYGIILTNTLSGLEEESYERG